MRFTMYFVARFQETASYLSKYVKLHYITLHRNYLKSPMVKNC